MGRKNDAPRDRFMDFRFARTIPHMDLRRCRGWTTGAGDGKLETAGGSHRMGGTCARGGGGGLHLEVG